MKRITIYDVAKEADVSLATVSRVINGSEVVREDTRIKVQEAIEKLGYKPNAIAQGLALQKTTTIAIVMPAASFFYTGQIINGLLDTAAAGTKQSTVRIKDSSGNETTCEITVEVSDDAEPASAGTQFFLQQRPDDITLILNAQHRLPQGWEPDDLTAIDDSADSGHVLREEAAAAWNELFSAAQEDSIAINVVSSFRTEEYQRTLFEGYLAVDPDAASYSAYPRTSEHELGLTVDISYDAQLHDDLQNSSLGDGPGAIDPRL